MNILEDLWNGKLCPISQSDCCSADYGNLVLLYRRNKEKLLATLNSNQLDSLQKMQDLEEEMRSMTDFAAFMTGFRLAVRLMVASLGDQ